MLTLQNISFSYALRDGWVPILRNISLTLPSRGLYLIQGENGVGKTTLFKLISRQCQPQSGTILLPQGIKLFTAWMKQHPILLSHLTCQEQWRIFKNTIHPDQWDTQIEQALFKTFEMTSFNVHRVSTLSGGEKQRLQFMMTYMTPAPIYLFDEPTTALDEKNKKIMVEWLALRSKQALVLVITHDPNLFEGTIDATLTIQNYQVHVHPIQPVLPLKIAKIIQPKKTKSTPQLLGMKSPVIPHYLTSWIPYLGIVIVLALLWFESSFDATLFQSIVGHPQTLFVHVHMRQSEPIEGTPFEWANYRELTREEQPNITQHFQDTWFLPNYSHLMPSVVELEHHLWTFLPYDDRFDIEPVVYASQTMNLTTISLTPQAAETHALPLRHWPRSTSSLLPQSPTLYFPYFWLKQSLVDQGFNVYETTKYWWVIPASTFHRQTYETIRHFESATAIVFQHALLIELQLVHESRPLIQGMFYIFGFVYSLGWLLLDGFMIERRWTANQLLRQWYLQFPFGNEHLHTMWKLWIVYDWFFFMLMVVSLFLMMVLMLNTLHIPFLIRYEPLLLVLWFIGNGLFRSTMVEVLSLQHD